MEEDVKAWEEAADALENIGLVIAAARVREALKVDGNPFGKVFKAVKKTAEVSNISMAPETILQTAILVVVGLI